MRDMNDIVKDRFGSLMMSLCEAEAIIGQKDGKIAELEEELKRLRESFQET